MAALNIDLSAFSNTGTAPSCREATKSSPA